MVALWPWVAHVCWKSFLYQLTAASGQVSEHGRAGQELLKSLEASQRLVPGAVGG